MTTDNKTGNAKNDTRNELSVQTLSSSNTNNPPPAAKKRWPWQLKLAFAAATGVASLGTYAAYDELMVSSALQSKFFSKLYKGEIFTETVTTPPPAVGNTDVERGYSEIQRIRKEAEAAGDKVSAQKPWKDRRIGPLHLAPIFDRKPQSGITILDMNGEKMYGGDTPHNVYSSYDSIPDIIVQSFCLVEDKNICDQSKDPTFNAAINWWRASQAAAMGVGKKLSIVSKVEGGSTLPIQITKNDSWEKGRTRGFLDKAEQMLTASTEMYSQGTDTREQRRNKIVEYINTASFAGHPSFGEIKGVKDAMAILYGNKDYDEKLRAMNDDAETARAFRQMFSLVMAVKMPDESLRSAKGYQALQERIDNFTKLLVDEKVITGSFAEKVKAAKIDFSEVGKNPALDAKPPRDKFVDSMRLAVMNKLKLNPVDGMYKLDRWDLQVDSTLDHAVNAAVTAKLKSYNDPEIAKQSGLTGFQLLRPEVAPKVTWAITINERLPDGRVVTRVSTDTFKGSLDLNKGGRQNYGSTSKMRMATTFLEVIAELHDKHAGKTPEELQALQIHPRDRLSRWAVNYLSNPENNPSLEEMQRVAISTIKYSGHRQGFFTGGGMNYPGNFDRREDHQSYSVQEALWESVNLSWYRISDDIEEYMKWGRLGIDAGILDDGERTPEQQRLRTKYLEEFADFEGTVFSGRFWRQQRGRIASELADSLAKKDDDHKTHLTALYRGFYPESSFEEYARFMNEFCKDCASKEEQRALFDDIKKKSKSSAASLLALHTDGSVESLVRLYRYTTPQANYEQTKTFILSLNKDLKTTHSKDADFSKQFNDYKSPVPQAVLDLLTEKTKGLKTKLAVVYSTLYPDAPFEDFEAYMRKECKSCGPKDDLLKLYNEHKPERQIDIVTAMAANTDRTPVTLLKLHRTFYPDASYQEARAFIAAMNPETDGFKDYNAEYNAARQANATMALSEMVNYTDRSSEQLAALLGRVKPGVSAEEMKAFVQPELANKKLRPDYKKLHQRYGATAYDPAALFYKFDLNDRGYLTRPIHPLKLAIAAERVKNPEISWKEALEKTRDDRVHVYKWLIHSNKKKAQDRSIGIILDHHAWREIARQWHAVGYPFQLVPSLATVIGVSGDTTSSLATLNSIFLNGGKSVQTTRISGIHLGVGTDHETHIEPGRPEQTQVMRETTAKLMLEMTRGVVNSERGTGRRVKEGFQLSDGRVLDLRGKTGTNDESETSGLRVGAFAGSIGDRYSVCISGYITGATARDKFTSGMAVQALKMLLPELKPLFDRSYGVTPESIAAFEAEQQAAKQAKKPARASGTKPAPVAKPAIAKPQQPAPAEKTTASVSQTFSASSAANDNTTAAKPEIKITEPVNKALPAATVIPR